MERIQQNSSIKTRKKVKMMKEALQDFEEPYVKRATWFGSGSVSGLSIFVTERISNEIEKKKVKAGMIFKGTPAAPGVIEGLAMAITSHKDLQKIRPGTILVCPCMAPTLTAIFPKIKAIVTDHGGTLASAATIAREYGIPAVVGTLVATESINDGDIIGVNGTVGRVEIVSRSH